MMGMKKSTVGLIAGAAVLIALSGASLTAGQAHAAGKTPPTHVKPQNGLVLGSLTAFSTTSVSITPAGGTSTTLPVGSYTRYMAHSQAAAAVGLKVGEQVAAFTTTDARGFRLRILQYDTVAFGIPVELTGTITSGTPTSLTIKTGDGSTVTVQLNGATHLRVNGVRATGLLAAPANQQVKVSGLQMTSGGIVARNVDIGGKPAGAQHVHVNGQVANSSGTTLSITVHKNSAPVLVQLTSATTYVVNGKLTTTAPTFTANQRVTVIATRQSDGSIVAVTVLVQ